MIRVRAQQILIETPKADAEPWIRIIVQRVEELNGIVNTVDRWDTFNARLSDVSDQTFPIPFDVSNNTFKIGDMAHMLTLIVMNWLAVQYGGTIDEEGNVIVEE
jgi:hypothetical protein